MPYLIDTPEQWFREQGKDLYTFEYQVDCDDWTSRDKKVAWKTQNERDVENLEQWFAVYLPEKPLTWIAPSEYSGWILGGPCCLTAEMDESSLAKFNQSWSCPESPWRVIKLSYASWIENIHACHLLPTPLTIRQPVSWWDTPRGFILLSANREGMLLSKWDAGWRLPQLGPDLKGIEAKSLPHGEYQPEMETGHAGYIIIDCGDLLHGTWNSREYQKNLTRLALLREALGIDAGEEVDISISD
jgi:hypothetical protein